MDIWDKIVSEQRSDFEEEPKDGHFDRFETKLSQIKRREKGLQFTFFLKAAAVLIIILISADLVVHLRKSEVQPKEAMVIKSDLGEATFYYTRKINTGIRDLERLASEGIGSKKEIIQIKHELSEMDSLFVNLQQEYKANPNDERIINAMIEYYQSKLDIVNTIKTDLENVKKLKIKKHENTEI